jgi:hypothetical protein
MIREYTIQSTARYKIVESTGNEWESGPSISVYTLQGSYVETFQGATIEHCRQMLERKYEN